MNCPHCAATTVRKRVKQTKLGYMTFFCPECRSLFNERTGTPFNFLEYPTDVVLLVVLWRLRYKLSFRDLAEMFLARGFSFTHEAVREWEARFAPLLADQLRVRRRGQAGRSWYVDETYIRVRRFGVCEDPTLRVARLKAQDLEDDWPTWRRKTKGKAACSKVRPERLLIFCHVRT